MQTSWHFKSRIVLVFGKYAPTNVQKTTIVQRCLSNRAFTLREGCANFNSEQRFIKYVLKGVRDASSLSA